MPEQAAEKRRRRRGLSLRVLMAAVLVIGGGLGWLSYRARVQREAVATLEAAGVRLAYDWYYPFKPDGTGPTGPPYARWAVNALGPDFFSNVAYVDFTGEPFVLPEGFGDEQMASLASLPYLKSVSIRYSTVTDAGLVHLRGLSGLKILSLWSDKGITDRGLVHLQGLNQLEYLILDLNDVQGPGLAHLGGLTRLKSLVLKETSPSDADMVPLSRLKSLEELYISGERLTDAGLAPLAGLTNLKTLDFNDNPGKCPGITGAGMAHLAALKHLESLSLNGTGVDSIEHLKGLTSLHYLTLKHTPIGDEGMPAVANLQALGMLCLEGTKVGDASLAHMVGLKNLKALFLDGTNVSDAGVPELSRMTWLTDLRVENTKITAEGAARLRKAFPPATVSWLHGTVE